MHLLALDTTTRDGSVALLTDGHVIAEERGDSARTHAERLPAELLQLLQPRGLAIADVGLFAVASGPGSFTGLRIGIATIQGLALASGRSMVAVSALEALADCAAQRAGAETIVAAWMDAHRHEVFGALYRVGPAGLVAELVGPTVGQPVATLERWAEHLDRSPLLFIGDGALLYRSVLEERVPAAVVADLPLLAGAIGRVATRRARDGGSIHPAAVQPLYVRRPDAELAREHARTHESAAKS